MFLFIVCLFVAVVLFIRTSFVNNNLHIFQKMQRKSFKNTSKSLESARECSVYSGFTFSTMSDVFFDSVSTTTEGKSDLDLDFGGPSRPGVRVRRSVEYRGEEYFPITKREIKDAEHDNFILNSLDTG